MNLGDLSAFDAESNKDWARIVHGHTIPGQSIGLLNYFDGPKMAQYNRKTRF